MKRLKNFIAHQKSKQLLMDVYKLLGQFPDTERFALCGRIHRAIVSVPSNIAAGMGRVSSKDQTHTLNIAYVSLMEVYAQLDIAHDFGYINNEMFNTVESDVEEISKMISTMASLRSISPASHL